MNNDNSTDRPDKAPPANAVPPDSPVPTFVRAARAAMSLSQDEFGALFDRAQTSVSFWERGTYVPDYETMVAMSVRSGIPLPGVPASSMPGGYRGAGGVGSSGAGVFGDALQEQLAKSLSDARRRLPKTMVTALAVSRPATLGELADFLKMLDDVMSRYPDAGG